MITSFQKPTALERGPVLLFHAIIFTAKACLKHSHFLKVKIQITWRTTKCKHLPWTSAKKCSAYSPLGRTETPWQISNYERFNRNNFNIRYWSWNYRGCWHQTCPPIDTREAVYVSLIPITRQKRLILIFLVTTSLCQDWVIYAPAAFLRCGSRFSGSLSGIEP